MKDQAAQLFLEVFNLAIIFAGVILTARGLRRAKATHKLVIDSGINHGMELWTANAVRTRRCQFFQQLGYLLLPPLARWFISGAYLPTWPSLIFGFMWACFSASGTWVVIANSRAFADLKIDPR